MIWELTRKEVLNKLLDFRFIITTVIALCLIVLTTVILSEQYLKEVNQYREFLISDENDIGETKIFSQLQLNAHYPPTPLSIFNKGVSQNLDKRFRITHVSVPRQGVTTSSENPFMNIFQLAALRIKVWAGIIPNILVHFPMSTGFQYIGIIFMLDYLLI